MAVYDLTQGVPSSIKPGDILNCPYSGQSIALTLPKGIYRLECWGADGGYGYTSESSYHGGAGGFSTGLLSLNNRTPAMLYVGGRGANGTSSASIKPGGFNGGGNSGYYLGGSGGGGTDIRLVEDDLYARVIVAGGGGGGSCQSSYYGGAGGGASGTAGSGYSSSYTAKGGTQTTGGAAGGYSGYQGSPGSFGVGGDASSTSSTSYNRSGGGGGGWYGGGGGGYRSSSSYYYYGNSGGGGGSGFVWTGENAPKGYLLDRQYYLTEASTTSGITLNAGPDGSGDGYIRITVVEAGTSILLISSASIVPGTVETQEAYTVSVYASEVRIEILGSEAAFEFPFENRYLDISDLIVEENTYTIIG